MKTAVWVGIMGMFGAMSRYSIGIWSNNTWGKYYNGDMGFLGTIVVNIVGCFLLPIVFIYLAKKYSDRKELITGMGTGFVGAFTTFSTFSLDNASFLMSGRFETAALYVIISIGAGLGASALGWFAGQKLLQHQFVKQEQARGKT